MYATLGSEALGIRGLTLPQAIDLARETGFAGLAFDARAAKRLVDERGADHVRGLFAAAGVRPALWGLPTAWRDDDRYRADLAELPAIAAAAKAIGCDRTATYIFSGSDERPFRENFDWHAQRLREIALVLRDAGCRFGLEYVGPRTFRAAFRHGFVYTLEGTLELIAAIGVDGVGLMLDSWHLYASGGKLADLDRLTNRDVVVVHVNDAPAGVDRDEQIDTVRALPLETGVLDLAGFMGKLETMGYDGPVMPEPFSQRVADLAATDPAAAAREAARSMAALWDAAGLREPVAGGESR